MEAVKTLVAKVRPELALSADSALAAFGALTPVELGGRILTVDQLVWAIERLTDQTERRGECWVFTGYIKNGYGALSVGNRPVYAHRLSCTLRHGPIPTGADVCHSCDNRRCWNPNHLRPDTRRGNVRDAYERGRAVPPPRITGLRHAKATLTDAQVEEVREAVNAGVHQRTLAAAYGVSQSTIWRVAHRKTRSQL